jgi:hypothetical protein
MSYAGTLTVPYRFVTIFIIAHGEDVKERTIGSFNATTQEGKYETFKSLFRTKTTQLNAKHYKLTLSGLTGNITNGSKTVDAIYSQIPRILAHDRTMSPLQKLYEVHKKMHSDFYFKDEVEVQSEGQRDHLRTREGVEYQRPPSRNENWFPEPTLISYDRSYSFNANPIKEGRRCRDVMERNQFGAWLLDASLDIATTILGFLPGCETEPLSLLTLLGISLSTSRTHASSDQTGATRIHLFTIMEKLMLRFGDDIHINVIDVTCRYYNWDKYSPGVEKWHKIGRVLQTLGGHLWTPLGDPVTHAGLRVTDEVPSAAATETADEYQPESVVLDHGQSLPVEKWYYDGNIKLSGLDNVWELKIRKEGSSVVVTSTETLSTHYNRVLFSIGSHGQEIDTTTLFEDNVQDRIVNGSSLETTHDIEVFYVLRKSPKIIVTLKRKPTMRGIESWLPGDHDTDTNAYLTLVSIEPGTEIRKWTIDPQSELFFKQVYDTVTRTEAGSKRKRSGGRKKQKKRRTRRRLRVKTNKSKKTRFRYSTSYRK